MNYDKLALLYKKFLFFLDGFPLPNPMERVIVGFLAFSILAYWLSRIIRYLKVATGAGVAMDRMRSSEGRRLKKEARKLQRQGKLVEAADIWLRFGKDNKA